MTAAGSAICAVVPFGLWRPRTMQAVSHVFHYAFGGQPIPPGYFTPEPHLVTGPFTLGDLTVTPVDLPHGRAITTGFLFSQAGRKRLAYLSDCQAVPDDVVQVVRGVEIAVLDALRPEPHPTHMCLDEALTAARRIGAGRRISPI
jgi:phosphoribosyl 1,2-cyclic phosphate phosphodiesterase